MDEPLLLLRFSEAPTNLAASTPRYILRRFDLTFPCITTRASPVSHPSGVGFIQASALACQNGIFYSTFNVPAAGACADRSGHGVSNKTQENPLHVKLQLLLSAPTHHYRQLLTHSLTHSLTSHSPTHSPPVPSGWKFLRSVAAGFLPTLNILLLILCTGKYTD